MRPALIKTAVAIINIFLVGCSSRENLLRSYVESPPNKRYDLICEKESVPISSFMSYINTQKLIGNQLESWRVKKISKTMSTQQTSLYDVNALDLAKDRNVSFTFAVHNYNGRECIQFVFGARLLDGIGPDFVNDKIFESRAYLPLKLGDYYNYNTSGLESQLYSTSVANPGDTGLENAHVYILKSDDINGEIFRALRTGNAYVGGLLTQWIPINRILFDNMSDYDRNRIKNEIQPMNGEYSIPGGDPGGIFFLRNPFLIKPQFSNNPSD